MTVRPGRNLIFATTCLAVCSVLVFADIRFFWLLLMTTTVLAVASEMDRRRAKARAILLSIKRTLPVVVGRDRQFDSLFRITNGGSSLRFGLRDIVPASCRPVLSMHDCFVDSNQTADLAVPYCIPTRGRHVFRNVWLTVPGPWGLMEVHQSYDCSGAVRVLPETFASREKLTKDLGAEALLLDKITRTRQHGAGTEFESLHAFREGDDPRRIDWRATARMRQPIVRRFQVERHRDVMILLDTGRLMGSDTDKGSKLDCAVDAALNLARVALQSGDRCGIAAYDSEVRGFLPPVAGIQALGNIVESVYDLGTRWNESDFTRIHAEMQVR